MNIFYCNYCNNNIPKELFCFSKGKKRSYCKACHALKEKQRRLKYTEQEKNDSLKRAMESYHRQRDKFKKLDKADSLLIHKWVIRNRVRRDLKSKKVRNLDYTFLKNKLEESLKIFPYMILRKFDGPKAFIASIDRIDPNLDYSENNVVVVPLWFNSGKLDLKIIQFLDMMKIVSSNEDIKNLYSKEEK